MSEILVGDCLVELGRLPAACVDLAFADPPFNIGCEYDVYNDRRSRAEYLLWTEQWLQAVRRVLKPDASFFEITRQLEYKAKWYGRTVVRLDRWFPSSKTWSGCGWINQNLKLVDRRWVCQGCGEDHDRDMNAAKMILKQGQIERRVPLERREFKRVDSGRTPTELSVG